MANYSTLKTAVADVVKTNGNQAITGANLQAVLLSIINSVGGGGYIFNGVATPSTNAGTPDENVFYIGGAGTYANFGTSVVVPPTNIAVFKYNGTWTCEQVTVENGGVFDISAFNTVGGTLAIYADLEAALGNNGANVPEGIRKGGMSIKFVQSYDNKYVQYRLMEDAFTTNTDYWAIFDGGVYVENPEWLFVFVDGNKNVLGGFRKDTGMDWIAGVPKPIKDYIDNNIDTIVVFLSNKVDKVTGKSLIDENYAESISSIENPEYFDVETDKNGNIVVALRKDFVKEVYAQVDFKESIKVPSAEIENLQVKNLSVSDNVDLEALNQLIAKEKLMRSYNIEHQLYNAPTISGNNTLTIPEGASVDANGNVYVGLAASDTAKGEHESLDLFYAELISFNLIDPSKNDAYKIFEYGKHYPAIDDGANRYNVFTTQVIAKIIDDNTVRVITNMLTWEFEGGEPKQPNPYQASFIAYRDFNRQTKTVSPDDAVTGIGVCTLKIGNNQPVALINNNVREMVQNMGNEEFPWTYGGSDYRNSVYCSNNPAELNGLFYDALSIGSGGHVLCSSPDLINWTYISDIPVGYYCEEVQLVTRNNYIFAFTRGRQQDSGYTDQSMPYNPHHMGMVLRYNLSTSQWDIKGEDAIILENSWGDRPTAAIKQNKIYAFIGNSTLNATIDDGKGSPRNGKRMYVFDMNLNILNTMDFGFQRGACNMMIATLNGNLFVFMASDLRGFFMHPTPADAVNMEGCTEGSFLCTGYNVTVAPAELDGSGHIVSINTGWQQITYNSAYSLYVSGNHYFRSLPADGRNGMTFAYIDNRMLNA